MKLEGRVVDLSSKGWGVTKTADGLTCFVPGAWPGDEIIFELLREEKFRLGRLLEWKKRSDAHRPSACPHFGFEPGQCGGCPWMGIHYEEQLKAKENKLSSVLRHFHVEPQIRHPIVASPLEFHYRNRVKVRRESQRLGFMSPLSHKHAPVKQCLVAEEWINNELRNTSMASGPDTDLWLQKQNDGLFAQANTLQNDAMKKALKERLQSQFENGLELFCGSGNFTEALLTRVKNLAALDGSAALVEILRNRLPSVQAHVVNLYSQSSLKISLRSFSKSEILFLDPPRSGLRNLEDVLSDLSQLKQVIYVSCNPVTFARDVSCLSDWILAEIMTFDLFPQTPHIEVMGFLERKVS